MLRINRIMLAMVALLVMTAAAWAQPDDYSNLTREPSSSGLEVKVWVDKGDKALYEPGEDIRVYFRTNRDAYVIIYNIDTRGNVHLLYPYEYRDRRFAEAYRTYRIPDLRDDYTLRVNGPEGVERIVAIATREPFYIPDLGWDLDPDQQTEEDYYYLHKPEGEDDWDFIERLNHRIVPDYADYELDVAAFQVEPRYPQRYYTEPSFYFSYRSYPYWYSPDVYFGAVYFDYPFQAAIYIDGIFFGYTPYYLPYFLYGQHYVTIYHQGYLVYRDYCYVRPHYQNRFYVPRDRIYKNYTSRFTKDYRVIKTKPEIFWTKVRDLNTKYKYTPAIKDDFQVGKTIKDKSSYADKYKGQGVSESKQSKEKLFREKLKPTTGDELVRIEGKKEKSTGSDKLVTPEKRLRQEKESQFKEKLSKGDDSFRSEMKESPEKKLRQSKEDQFRKQDEFSKVNRGDNSFKSELNDFPENQMKKSKESQFRQQEEFLIRESKEKTIRKESEQRGSGELNSFKQSQRVESEQRMDRVEKPQSVQKAKVDSDRSSRQESSSRNKSYSPPSYSGKGERTAPKSKK